MKHFILAISLFLAGCGGADLRHQGPGQPLAFCEARPAWKDVPRCQVRGQLQPCLKVASGPGVVASVVTSGSCPSRMVGLIQDTWQNGDDSGTVWSIAAPRYTQLHLQNLELMQGQSLYITTDGPNDKQDCSCCYVHVEMK